MCRRRTCIAGRVAPRVVVLFAGWAGFVIVEFFRPDFRPAASTYVQGATLAAEFFGYVLDWQRELLGGVMTLVGTAAFFCGDRIRSASVATGGVDSGRAVCRSWRAIPAGFVRRRPQAACSGAMRAVDYGGPSRCCRGGSRCFLGRRAMFVSGGTLVPEAPANSLSLTAKGGSPWAESNVRQRTLRAADLAWRV